ncbi:uroporphyrinogen-III synthase [uncultured Tateyamaria sp.]|uniref:uroporphyrinogen-III synthase n=1 Tax=uncultured Tateyamaria sp. TaxID=455651 RepID=UPI0026038A1C|nr:uroporphyrinogen-III synthase [uncultured Tateyamaria sp.]
MTRPRAASKTFLADLPATLMVHLSPIFSPLIRIEQLSPQLDMGPKDSAVFSSANGVAAAPDGLGRAAYCIGPATTKAALARGWEATQAGQDADSLVAAMQTIRPDNTLLHLAGVHTRGNIAGRLSRAGMTIRHVALYDQVLGTLTDEATQIIASAPCVIVPLFSPRTAAQFAKLTPASETVHIIALSPTIAQELTPTHFASLTVAKRPNAQAMGDALSEAVTRNRL